MEGVQRKMKGKIVLEEGQIEKDGRLDRGLEEVSRDEYIRMDIQREESVTS